MTFFVPSDDRNILLHNLSASVVSYQSFTTSQVDISGTEVMYEVKNSYNANYVVYEYRMQLSWPDDLDSRAYLELWQQTDINDASTYASLGTSYRVSEKYDNQRQDAMLTGKFLIPIYTGSRKFKLKARARDTSSYFTLHQDAALNRYTPVIKMYIV